MTNRDMGVTNGPVELGAPTLTINPPVKPEETVSQAASEKAEPNDAASQDEGKL